MKTLLDTLRDGRAILSDGAWGTMLLQRGLESGECPELWNVTRPGDVMAIARSYVHAGAEVILTNTFGGSPMRLSRFGLRDRCARLNEAGAAISRKAAGRDRFVFGSIGPTGEIESDEPTNDGELYEGFKVQAQALERGGVDAILIETMYSLREALAALRAARESTHLDVICTFTFDRTASGLYLSRTGVSPSQMAKALKESGAAVIGANCGNGFDQMAEVIAEIRIAEPSLPLLARPNAGLPVNRDGKMVYEVSPESAAAKSREFVRLGANIVGGCCGTGPEHIRAMAAELQKS